MMKNRIEITLGGLPYTITTTDSPEYTQRVAEHVDAAIRAITSSSKEFSLMQATALAALNICDEHLKAVASAENLRTQMKSYMDEAARTRVECVEAKRENAMLQEEVKRLKSKMGNV